MKNYKTTLLSGALLMCGAFVSAQTADEIIAKYVQAIGGKDFLSKITSLYTESKMDVMGNESTQKVTILNGKGYKTEMEIMGSNIVTCITDNGGWSVNPMMGSNDATALPDDQYKSSKSQIWIGGPFVNYKENGYQAELQGNETIGDVNAVKVKLTSPDNISVTYSFDPATGYLLKSVQQSDMQGQTVDNTITFSDYRQASGYTLPYKVSMDIGGMFQLSSTITSVELNKAVDPAIFVKP
ncbi:MAG: hypothetical protein Q8868_15280 [Bacteroidota bacterium]|nr:hypothetical protein [Bacteroidota bacterium]